MKLACRPPDFRPVSGTLTQTLTLRFSEAMRPLVKGVFERYATNGLVRFDMGDIPLEAQRRSPLSPVRYFV